MLPKSQDKPRFTLDIDADLDIFALNQGNQNIFFAA